jgi:chromosome segregation ATPase
MALTAARSELNVALVGESDVSAMLEQSKRQMAELEAKIRSLTGASKEQTAAAKASGSGLDAVNGKMTGLAKRAEGLVEGVDKVKGAFNKVVESAGFIGMAVSGAVTAFEFLRDIFDDSAEEAAKLEAQMQATKAKTEQLKNSIDRLSGSMRAMQAATGQGAAALASERAALSELQGDFERAAFEREGAAFEQAKQREADLRRDKANTLAAELESRKQLTTADVQIADLKRKQAAEDLALLHEENRARNAGRIEERKEIEAQRRTKAFQYTLDIANATVLKSVAEQANQAANEQLEQITERVGIASQTTRQMLENISKFGQVSVPQPDAGGGGGGGGGGGARQMMEMAAVREAERQQFLEWLGETQREAAALNKLRADNAKADEVRRNAVRDEAALFDELGAMRLKVTAELGNLPTTGVTAEAFKDLRDKLAKQLAEIDRLTAARVQASRDGGMTTAEEDAITAALARQREEMEKLASMTEDLAVARGKAAQVAAEELEKARLAKPLEDLEKYKEGIGQLTQMAVPAFGEIGTVLSQVTDQLQKYKDGQTSMTKAVTNSASSIAGAIAKQVGGVKAEAGVRALFETAMGFATLVSNPVESAGHFTAAAMFGLAAGGVLKTGASSGAGGQKAPPTRTASTTATSSSGGGGPITNVYNLQTGIVDGQSTARAFRQAEQQARNTGMASAGGW